MGSWNITRSKTTLTALLAGVFTAPKGSSGHSQRRRQSMKCKRAAISICKRQFEKRKGMRCWLLDELAGVTHPFYTFVRAMVISNVCTWWISSLERLPTPHQNYGCVIYTVHFSGDGYCRYGQFGIVVRLMVQNIEGWGGSRCTWLITDPALSRTWALTERPLSLDRWWEILSEQPPERPH